MKRLLLLLLLLPFIGNTQVVTISGFGTKEKFGPVDSRTDFDKILFDKYDALPSEDLPVSYKYVVNFATKQCTLYDGNGEFVVTVIFKVIDKKSDQDFQIEFTDNDLEDDYGIIVKDTVAAHTQYNGKAVFLTIFDAAFIY
jgi:hypothetical protein